MSIVSTISENGIKLIKDFESLQLAAYYDRTGTLTIGYGHTGEGVTKGHITEDEANQYLDADLKKFVNGS